MLDGDLNHGKRNALGPTRLLRQETMDELDVQLSLFGGYAKFFHYPLRFRDAPFMVFGGKCSGLQLRETMARLANWMRKGRRAWRASVDSNGGSLALATLRAGKGQRLRLAAMLEREGAGPAVLGQRQLAGTVFVDLSPIGAWFE